MTQISAFRYLSNDTARCAAARQKEVTVTWNRWGLDLASQNKPSNDSCTFNNYRKEMEKHKKVRSTLMGASNDLATLTMTGVQKTQKISYMKSPACGWSSTSKISPLHLTVHIKLCSIQNLQAPLNIAIKWFKTETTWSNLLGIAKRYLALSIREHHIWTVNSMITRRIAPILKEPRESISIPCTKHAG